MPAENESGGDEVTFTCASCQYRTTGEEDFMKHCKSEHRNELSLWCITCDKCFSNCGLLIAHIKEGDCVKEDMVYRCGAKECKFKTEKGQILVHHLRHVHRGSPFLYCVECDKLFTLPHCLILHMQNECTFKERHRKNYVDNSKPADEEEKSSDTSEKKEDDEEEEEEEEEAKEEDEDSPPPPPAKTKATPKSASKAKAAGKAKGSPGKGRGRGAGRGRRGGGVGRSSKVYHSESSGSDLDDPSWSKEDADSQPLRRSSRSSRKIVTNEDFDSDDYEDDFEVNKKRRVH